MRFENLREEIGGETRVDEQDFILGEEEGS
jgi:hypothetical protein